LRSDKYGSSVSIRPGCYNWGLVRGGGKEVIEETLFNPRKLRSMAGKLDGRKERELKKRREEK